MMSESTSGGERISTSSQSTMPAYRDVATKLVANTPTISRTVRFWGSRILLSRSTAKGYLECRNPRNQMMETMARAIR